MVTKYTSELRRNWDVRFSPEDVPLDERVRLRMLEEERMVLRVRSYARRLSLPVYSDRSEQRSRWLDDLCR